MLQEKTKIITFAENLIYDNEENNPFDCSFCPFVA